MAILIPGNDVQLKLLVSRYKRKRALIREFQASYSGIYIISSKTVHGLMATSIHSSDMFFNQSLNLIQKLTCYLYAFNFKQSSESTNIFILHISYHES